MIRLNTSSKLFLLSGALCSGLAFALIFVLDNPISKNIVSNYNSKQVSAVVNSMGEGSVNLQNNSQINIKEFAALSVLTSKDVLNATGHIPTNREIIADLSLKKVTVLEGPAVIAEYPILSVGRPGTFWETPSGDYSIKTKEIKHLSSIGQTWMPYSMQFYGNFFIHGWPTYKDGTDVPKGYSGGCIRLSTNDSKKLYELSTIGTHMHVRGSDVVSDGNNASFYMKNIDTPPEVNATSFAVFDMHSEKLLWSKGLDSYVDASKISSILTALVSVETIDQYKYINFEDLLAGKGLSRAKESDPSSVQVGALLYPLLFDQSDIAARAIVELRGKKVFKNYMNEKSLAIGMASTSWGGGVGSDISTTTARDASRLLSYIDKQKNFLIKTTLAENRSFDEAGVKRFSWKNKNDWIKDATFQGGIISKGNSVSGSSLAIYALPMSEFGTRKIGFVVLNSNDVKKDLSIIKDYASTHFFYGTEANAEENYASDLELEAKAVMLKKIKEQLIN
jgi:D-alanyl-D-alanine carboxypeptidase/lipoprotein-anchoring transpeptidase ErfK/SrfK